MNNTIVVNIFAGPGAGKTTAAWEIAANLKKKGIETEYVPEYAKELVWDESDKIIGTISNQSDIYKEQKHRIDRLLGKVDVVVTDSPIILSACYALEELNENEELLNFKKGILEDFSCYHNFNLFIQRNMNSYQQAGRVHSLQEAIGLDQKIKNLLRDNSIYYGVYNQNEADLICNNIIMHLNGSCFLKEEPEEEFER